MDFRRLTDKAKDLVDKRGGTGSLKGDAEELKGIATGGGSLADKAKAAAAALKDPGAADAPASPASAPERSTPAEGKPRAERGSGRGRGGRRRRRDRPPAG